MPIRTPVAGVDISETKCDYKKHNREFNDHNGGVESRTLLNANHQDRGNDQGDYERRQIEADLNAKNLGRSEQIMRALDQFGRLRGHDLGYFSQKRLRARDQRRI